jgi:hypothetical protein
VPEFRDELPAYALMVGGVLVLLVLVALWFPAYKASVAGNVTAKLSNATLNITAGNVTVTPA